MRQSSGGGCAVRDPDELLSVKNDLSQEKALLVMFGEDSREVRIMVWVMVAKVSLRFRMRMLW